MRILRALVNLAVFVIMVALAPTGVQAQFENYSWYFGQGLGLDFSTKPPTIIRNGRTSSFEGTASISDPTTGNLLFYTDGITVWDRTHNPMPDGNGLASDVSSTQAAMIIPDPANSNKYYIFTADQSGYNGDARGINYSTVDLTRNAGLGDIVDKNVPMLTKASEKLTAVKICQGSGYWVIGHEFVSNRFFAWKVDANGVNPPVISATGSMHGPDPGDGIGWMTASPDGTKLGLAFYERSQTPGNVELFHFDPLTGIVSDPILLRRALQPYGICFSPSGRKVYVTSVGQLEQFDVTNWDEASMHGSWETMTSVSKENGAVKLGPDGKIYVQHNTYLGTISFPELRGVQCQYVENVFTENTYVQWGLPNNVDAESSLTCGAPEAHIKIFSDTLCEGECLNFFDSSRNSPTTWKWEFEGATPLTSTDKDPQHICFPKQGLYKIQLTVSNESGSSTATSDIFIRKCLPPKVSLRDTTFCKGNCVTFIDTSTGDYVREWRFEGGRPNALYGNKPAPVCFDSAGTFTVRLIASNDWGSDTAYSIVTVDACPWPVARSEYDTLICAGEPLNVTDRSANDPTSWDWLFEGAEPGLSSEKNPQHIVYDAPGFYQIRQIVRNAYGADTALTRIQVKECRAPESKLFDQELCEGDCIVLSDSSTFEPTAWEWVLTGPSNQSFSIKDPGLVCFTSAGVYQLQLVTSNDYGQDTARSTIVVHTAEGHASSLDSVTITLCESLDTFVTLYSGCRSLPYHLILSNDPSVIVTVDSGSISADDSIRIPLRITPQAVGLFTADVFFTLGSDTLNTRIVFKVTSDTERFSFSDFNGAFSALACEPGIHSLSITNDACADHQILWAAIEPPNTGFSLAGGSFPITLESNAVTQLAVQYDANITVAAQAELIIKLGSGEEKRYPLSGKRLLPKSGALRFEVAGPGELLPNEPTSARLSFDEEVESALAPEVLEISMRYNTDLISASSFDLQDGWTLVSQKEQAGDLTIRLAREKKAIANKAPIVGIQFKSFVAAASYTTIKLDHVLCNPDDADFERCVFDLNGTDTSQIAMLPICTTPELQTALSNSLLFSVVVRPHPVRPGDDPTLLVRAAEVLRGQPVFIRLIDVVGRCIELPSAVLGTVEQSITLPLQGVSSGVYGLQVRIGMETKTLTLVIE